MIAGERPSGLVILGHPVAHSLSPVFQGAALAASGLALTYTRRDVPPERLREALHTCRDTNTGGNVTIPHKEAVAAEADRLSETARRAGAVNTFWFERGLLHGHNTDVDGARATMQALMAGRSARRAVLLGSGGSAAAVLLALAEMGATEIAIVARTPARAHALLARTGVSGVVLDAHDDAPGALGNADLVVNSTPLGLRDDDALPVEPSALSPHAAVFDLVYRGRTAGQSGGTPWVRAARAHGLAAEDGLRMLVEQGASAFRSWFGIDAPRDVMWQALGEQAPAPDRPRP
ncbi:MAG TPA: shikimate dehydrogenase [Gemmatimonas sp.]|uniref:shikimate dehydrogenase family protein n=1 Tax=Gemmatimonas sp. TaxID=1962908 RepID=UPI002ED815D8